MNRVFIQLWEESIKNDSCFADGCSIHSDLESLQSFINSIYKERENKIPTRYERIVGPIIEGFVEDELFNKISSEKNIRLTQTELNNLLKLEEILIKK